MITQYLLGDAEAQEVHNLIRKILGLMNVGFEALGKFSKAEVNELDIVLESACRRGQFIISMVKLPEHQRDWGAENYWDVYYICEDEYDVTLALLSQKLEITPDCYNGNKRRAKSIIDAKKKVDLCWKLFGRSPNIKEVVEMVESEKGFDAELAYYLLDG